MLIIMAVISWTFYKQNIIMVQIVAMSLGIAGVIMVFQREIYPNTFDWNKLHCSNVLSLPQWWNDCIRLWRCFSRWKCNCWIR